MITTVPYLGQSAPTVSVMSTVSLFLQMLSFVVLPMTIACFSVKDYTRGDVLAKFGKNLL